MVEVTLGKERYSMGLVQRKDGGVMQLCWWKLSQNEPVWQVRELTSLSEVPRKPNP